jgi:hypothetical protein
MVVAEAAAESGDILWLLGGVTNLAEPSYDMLTGLWLRGGEYGGGGGGDASGFSSVIPRPGHITHE